MLNNRNKINFVTICYWLSLLCLSAKSNVQALSIQKAHASENDVGHNEHIVSINGNDSGNGNGNRNGNALQSDATAPNFNPRMEYNNEWRPVGRGDPLKNDPTYDYSPPALERVRYWRAENESKPESNNPKQQKKDYAISNKKEILLLGMPSERHRGQPIHSETSVIQPKYSSIRRSYYAHQHQLPTHLMPPPMQTLAPSAHMIKNSAVMEYRHSMPSSATTTSTMSMMHNTKPYSSTPWMASMPTSVSMSPSLPSMMHRQTPNMPQMHMNHDNNQHHQHHHHHHLQHQESINQFSYTRPTSFSPNNFVDSNQNSFKLRKPWLHELLQKEAVKVPPKPVIHKYSTNYEPITSTMGSSIKTTYSPVSFVPLPSTTPQTTMLTSTSTSTAPALVYTTTSPVYFTTTMPTATTTTTQKIQFLNSPSTPTSNRLLIPTTSNLMHRPTVTPIEMTTDPLFKHYKQPAQPLLGPMYLIIEGHSKVKTYGKDELDPHKPKIVPIIPNREPVVRMADPNDKPDSTVSFHVKHLHTKATTPNTDATKSTKKPTISTTTTTNAPKAKKSSTASPSTKPTTTTIKQTTDATTTHNPQLPTTELPTGMGGFFDFLDSSLGNIFREGPTTGEIGEISENNRPQENIMLPMTTTKPSATELNSLTTIATKKPTEVEARIGTHAGSIESLLDFEDDELSDDRVTTQPVPRDVRQVFDYDQLPESRLKDRMDVNSAEDENDDDDESANIEDGVIGLHDDDSGEGLDLGDVESLEPEEYDDASQELIKRIDRFVDEIDENDNDEAEFEELVSTEVDANDDIEIRRAKEA